MVETKISHYLIGIIAFTAVILAGMSMIGELNKADSTFSGKYETFNSTFNVYDNVTSEIEGMSDSLPDVDASQFGVFGVLNALIQSSWQTLRLSVQSFGFMDAVFNGLSNEIPAIPTWVGGLIIAAILVVFVFAIFGAIFQRDL